MIRLATEADSSAVAEIYRHYVECSHFTFEEVPPAAAELAARMSDPIRPWLVAEVDDHILGYASTAPMRNRAAYRWSVETGIYLAAGAHGRGLGKRLLVMLTDLLERQGYVTAIGAIALPNDASVRLHEALGFVHAGTYRGTGFKLGQWIDVGLWQKELAPRSPTPAEPLPYASIDTPE